MSAIASLRSRALEIGWAVFATANVIAMLLSPPLSPAPFHFIWVSLTIVYGFRVWRPWPTLAILLLVAVVTGLVIVRHAFLSGEPLVELVEVPLMSAMFLAMVWHAGRRQQAMREVERVAEERALLLERQKQFLHDVSHELRTPVTIARGHLEILRGTGGSSAESEVALDELERLERIIERLLLLARAGQPALVMREQLDAESFLEDLFVRWSDTVPRPWQLGGLAAGTIAVDGDALRAALDGLLENAVKYTTPSQKIELSSRAADGVLVIRIADEGTGIPPDALGKIFERFARVDGARSRLGGGVGLGLAIVDAVARAHDGTCSVESSPGGSVFSLRLPGFEASPMPGDG